MKTCAVFRLGLLAAAASLSTGAIATDATPVSVSAVANFNSCAKPIWPKEALRNGQTGTVTLAGAVARGDALAQNAMAYRAMMGQGVPQNAGEAARVYRLAAEQGNAAAQNSLGLLMERGSGVPLDHAEAVLWYRRAADQGLPLAEYNFGRMVAIGRFSPARLRAPRTPAPP